jgi:hypothetical protein
MGLLSGKEDLGQILSKLIENKKNHLKDTQFVYQKILKIMKLSFKKQSNSGTKLQ